MSASDRSSPPAPAPIRPFRFPSIERQSLANGLSLLTVRKAEVPLVTAALVVDAGAAVAPVQLAGLARLAANALEVGTASRSADDIAWELEYLGAGLEVQAGWDAALLMLTVPAERLEPALALFADLVRHPAFPEAEVQRLRDEQLADILQRRKDPGALANDLAARFIFRPGTPYAYPLAGTRESVSALGRAELEAFHRGRYAPGASALVLAGDIDAAAARALAERHLGGWPGDGTPEPPFEVAPAFDATSVVVVHRPEAVQSEIRIGGVGVPRSHPDYFPIVVMNAVLGGTFASRLNMNLRERNGFTYGAQSSFAFRRQAGPFVLQAAVATEVTARAVEEALKEVATLRDQIAPDEEVAAARDYLAGVMPLELETTEQLAGRLAELVVHRLPDDHLSRYPERIQAVTPADVWRVAAERIRPDRLMVVIVGDADQVAGPLGDLGIAPVNVHRPEEE